MYEYVDYIKLLGDVLEVLSPNIEGDMSDIQINNFSLF